MSPAALALVRHAPAPPLPPGQRCFEFLPLVIVVHPPRKRGATVCRVAHGEQLPLAPRAPAPRRSPALKAFVPRRLLEGARPRSMGAHPLTAAERTDMDREVAALTWAGVYEHRPQTFGDCPPGPCPWVSCRHHLKLDVDLVNRSVKDNFPGVDVDEMVATCSLRVADTVGDELMSLEKVGGFVNVTMERARQLVGEALLNTLRALKRSTP